MMKYLPYLALFSTILFSCSNEDQKKEDADEAVQTDTTAVKTGTELPENTLTILNNAMEEAGKPTPADVNWNSFQLTRFWKEDSTIVQPFQPPADYYQSYGQFLIYSPDSTRFIDLDSYNIAIHRQKNGKLVGEEQGPDTEISLIDKTKNQKTRLVFFGPGGSIEDAKWVDNENLVLIGTMETDKEGEKKAAIFRYNIPTKTFQVYESADSRTLEHLKGYAKRERLKAVNIR